MSPMSTHVRSSHVFDDLAFALDERPLADQPLAVLRSLDAVVRRARAAAVPSVIVDVLADPSQPEVARLRAFGRISALLDVPSFSPTVRPAA